MDDLYALAGFEDHEPFDLSSLFRRYLGAYGPATVEDFASWSGLRLSVVRRIVLTGVCETGFGLVLDGVPPARPERAVALLGHFDTYLLGYRDRSLALASEFVSKIQTGGGFLRPHVLLDGRVVGTWQRVDGELVITPFLPEQGGELRELVGEDTR